MRDKEWIQSSHYNRCSYIYEVNFIIITLCSLPLVQAKTDPIIVSDVSYKIIFTSKFFSIQYSFSVKRVLWMHATFWYMITIAEDYWASGYLINFLFIYYWYFFKISTQRQHESTLESFKNMIITFRFILNAHYKARSWYLHKTCAIYLALVIMKYVYI